MHLRLGVLTAAFVLFSSVLTACAGDPPCDTDAVPRYVVDIKEGESLGGLSPCTDNGNCGANQVCATVHLEACQTIPLCWTEEDTQKLTCPNGGKPMFLRSNPAQFACPG